MSYKHNKIDSYKFHDHPEAILSNKTKKKPQRSLADSKSTLSQKLSVSEFDNSMVIMSESDSYKGALKI